MKMRNKKKIKEKKEKKKEENNTKTKRTLKIKNANKIETNPIYKYSFKNFLFLFGKGRQASWRRLFQLSDLKRFPGLFRASEIDINPSPG